MSKLSRDNLGPKQGLPLHPREIIFSSGNLGALNAEIVIASDGCATVSIDLRGTFNLTAEVSGTVDGVNWTPIPVRPINQALKRFVPAITGTAVGVWMGSCVGYKDVRIRCTNFTSGAAATVIAASTVVNDPSVEIFCTTDIVTTVSVAGAAATLTLPAPGTGLRQYLTYLSINRFAAAALVAAAAPVNVTTTNIPNALAFSLPADAAAQGTMYPWREDFAFPIAALAQNTAVQILCPLTTGVIWRVTAGYLVLP